MLEDTLFLIQCIVTIVCFLILLFDVFNEGTWLDWRYILMCFIVILLCISIGQNIFILDPEVLLYSVMMKLEHFVAGLFWFFLVIDILLKIKSQTTGGREAYTPLKK